MGFAGGEIQPSVVYGENCESKATDPTIVKHDNVWHVCIECQYCP